MELMLRRIPGHRKIHSASFDSELLIDISRSEERGNLLSLSSWQKAEWDEDVVHLPVAKWERVGGEELGSCSALDVRKKIVYASLKDRRRLALMPFTSPQSGLEANVIQLNFGSPLFGLVALQCLDSPTEGSVIVAVSATGELEAFCVTATVATVRRKPLKSLSLASVLFVSAFENEHLLVFGMREESIVMHAVQFTDSSDFGSLHVEGLPTLVLPRPPASVISSRTLGDSFILGVLITERFAFILYSGGFVHVLAPDSQVVACQKGALAAWYEKRRSDGSESAPEAVSKLTHAFRLSPGSAEDNSMTIADIWKGVKHDAGGVADVGGGYVAVGYGQYVSIWDGIYMVGHGVVQIAGRVTGICGDGFARALIASEKGFDCMLIGNRAPLSLGLAVKRKGSCDAIVTSLQQDSHSAPIHSQPVTVGAIRTAAEAGASPDEVFRPVMKNLDSEEMKIVRALVDRNATGTPEAVAQLTQKYTTEFKKVRRGNRGKAVDLGLSALPSERLAAVSVARCLYELHFGHAKYVVPLIDMLGTGVVSSEAVLPVIEMSDSWQMGPESQPLRLRSIVDPLITSPTFLSALEAMVLRVADLPERDIVRIAQFSVRLVQASSVSGDESDDVGDSESKASLLRLRHMSHATRLLLMCTNASVNRTRIVDALRQVPLADVTALLGHFGQMLDGPIPPFSLSMTSKLPPVPPSVRRGYFGPASADLDVELYRGVGNWLDNEDSGTGRASDASQLRGCIEWSCHIIDAHLATLIMDKQGRALTVQLLKTVRQRRREFDVLKSLEGLTFHLSGQLPLPNQHDPLYSSTVIEVPAYAALE